MANPNPQHNPTDGLGVAAFVQLTGTNLTNRSGGSLAHPGSNGGNGQGIGATASSGSGAGTFPVAQYALTQSLSAAGGFAATTQLAVVLKDVQNNTYSPTGSPVYKSYNNPGVSGTPAWYKPSNGTAGPNTYNPNVASVSGSGLITALAVGQAIIEVQFPTFDNTEGDSSGTGDPFDMIYAQIVVTVIP